MSFLLPSDYGVIGNQSSAALISRLGSIDWCCFPFLDSASHFASILDEAQGGRFQIRPQGDFRSEQHYRQRSHVLETTFETPFGRGKITDWMPLGSSACLDPILYRKVEMIEGRINWHIECVPRFNYGMRTAQAEYHPGGVLFRGGSPDELAQLSADVPLSISSDNTCVAGRFSLDVSRAARFAWSWGRRTGIPDFPEPDDTINGWRSWAHRCPPEDCPFAGPWHDAVTRSALTLKLLTTAFAGSLSEAVTTSIPILAGGSRTWDYRYSWLCDSASAIEAWIALGYLPEAKAHFQWLAGIIERDGASNLQPVYTLDGGTLLPEHELGHLSGYQGSGPVRVGNASPNRFQLDVYGQAFLAVTAYHRTFQELPISLWPKLVEIADHVCQVWRRPDIGPWEVRSKPEHFVASKLMCWVALDRACSLATAIGKKQNPKWAHERELLHRTICDQGYDKSRKSFIRAFGDRAIDASTLLIPTVGFLPIDDPRVINTLHAVDRELSVKGAILRRHKASDGIDDPEGGHLWSSFLYVSCLALSGRLEEATDRMIELCSFATPLGLFGEQMDLTRGGTTGNFPSAAVHLASLNAALAIGTARRKLSQPSGLPKTIDAQKPAPRFKRR